MIIHRVNSILISRFMLNLRVVHSCEADDGDTTFTQGHIAFVQTRILGDLAAYIDYSSSSSSDLSSELPDVLDDDSVTEPSAVLPPDPDARTL